MPHCPSYEELDKLLESALSNGPQGMLGVNGYQLAAIIKDLKQCRARLAKKAIEDKHGEPPKRKK